MEAYFSDVRARWQDELLGDPDGPCPREAIADSQAVRACRGGDGYDALIALGDALARQMRYREALAAARKAMALRPDAPEPLRRCAGRRLTLLRLDEAKADFLRCMALAGETPDVTYRLGLCCYLQNDHAAAQGWFVRCFAAAGEELGVAAIYWEALAAMRLGGQSALLPHYRTDMDVGHHAAYARAAAAMAGVMPMEALLGALGDEASDMDFAILAYGAAALLLRAGERARSGALRERVLQRDAEWPCFAWLANRKELWDQEGERCDTAGIL